jgi:hypothetical protein
MLTHNTVVYPIDVMIRLHSCGVKSRCRWGNEDIDMSISVVLCEMGIRGQRLYHISTRNRVEVNAGASMLGEHTEGQAVFVIIPRYGRRPPVVADCSRGLPQFSF